ncbi:hypothetical protein X777_15607, partial [Ooceraea biroi]
CKTQIAYNRNTSTLCVHLQNKHAQELLELESSNSPCRQIVSQDHKECKAQKRLHRRDHVRTGTDVRRMEIKRHQQLRYHISAYYLNIEEAKLKRKILTTVYTPSDWKEVH